MECILSGWEELQWEFQEGEGRRWGEADGFLFAGVGLVASEEATKYKYRFKNKK